jgi:hypothetical protein
LIRKDKIPFEKITRDILIKLIEENEINAIFKMRGKNVSKIERINININNSLPQININQSYPESHLISDYKNIPYDNLVTITEDDSIIDDNYCNNQGKSSDAALSLEIVQESSLMICSIDDP